MPLQFLRARKVRARNAGLANHYSRSANSDFPGVRFGHQAKADLPASGEFHIDLRKQLRVE